MFIVTSFKEFDEKDKLQHRRGLIIPLTAIKCIRESQYGGTEIQYADGSPAFKVEDSFGTIEKQLESQLLKG